MLFPTPKQRCPSTEGKPFKCRYNLEFDSAALGTWEVRRVESVDVAEWSMTSSDGGHVIVGLVAEVFRVGYGGDGVHRARVVVTCQYSRPNTSPL